jgi:formylglycine-generating enzyme required for sulfatase activity
VKGRYILIVLFSFFLTAIILGFFTRLPRREVTTVREESNLTEEYCESLGMAHFGNFCIDKYEASRSDADSTSSGFSYAPASQPGVIPWTSISQAEARRACELAGKRLCTNEEWQIATGTSPTNLACPRGNNDYGKAVENPSETCVPDPTYPHGRCLTGSGPPSWCTPRGVCDLNGNVWEWVDGVYGHLSPCNLLIRGHITDWNWNLNCPSSRGGPSIKYGNDFYWPPRFWGAGAILRGGAWTTGEGAGCFTMTLWNPPSHANPHIGFRCCL